MSSLLIVLNIIVAIFMEKKTRKNSTNSGIPPSQTEKDETARPPPGSNKKGRTDEGVQVNNTRHRETITVSKVEQCDVCAEPLGPIDCSHYERRTKIDIIFERVTELEQWEQESIERRLDSPTIYVDETSFRVDKKNHWIHVYSSDGLTIKLLHRKRGLEAIESFNIIPRYKGVIIHDCLSAYLSFNHCGHGLCGSHLLRELTFIVESNHYRWASAMKKRLKETAKNVAKRDSRCLTESEYALLQKRYRTILTQGEKELPPIPPRAKGKRGRLAKSDAHNLHGRFTKHETAVLIFAKDPDVAFTNNRAERDLRMAKVKQKVSGCFRSERYAHTYCRISSYLQTMAYRGVNPLVAIQMALSGVLYEKR